VRANETYSKYIFAMHKILYLPPHKSILIYFWRPEDVARTSYEFGIKIEGYYD